jgi:hypothetical protein
MLYRNMIFRHNNPLGMRYKVLVVYRIFGIDQFIAGSNEGLWSFVLSNPYTISPGSRIRPANQVKSLFLETRQKPSKWLKHGRSIASMIIAESGAFLPWVYANCCMGWIACRRSSSF